ncbi:hypothetical protein DH2020_049098 [Rehmannia glutinosa]|uniref:Uncharacterized protein n=1 Tax=Rehmannia glutinosa TaxID=99300 RepID=A0ABR0U402_REHGL
MLDPHELFTHFASDKFPWRRFTTSLALVPLLLVLGQHRGFVVRNASPEAAAGDLLSSFPLPTIPGFSDNPWRLIRAQTVEKIADTVGKVAEEVDKAAEDIAEALPEGGLKKVVSFVEDLAEETTKEAQRVEDLMDKVEELDDKLEAFLEKQSKGTEKA